MADRPLHVIEDLVALSENEWIDLNAPEKTREIIVSRETAQLLGYAQDAGLSVERYRVTLAPSEQQIQTLTNYAEQYRTNDDSFFYNALDVIVPRSNLRFARLKVEPVPPEG